MYLACNKRKIVYLMSMNAIFLGGCRHAIEQVGKKILALKAFATPQNRPASNHNINNH